MDITIRDIEKRDMGYILDLNEKNVVFLSPMDEERFDYLVSAGDVSKIAEVDGEPAAFILALREGVKGNENSENYVWFSDRYETFLYVDRIVIDERFRRIGLGRALYEDVFDHAKRSDVPVVTAEVDIIPYNDPSLRFHDEMGFQEVGQQIIRNGEIKVSMQVHVIFSS